MYQNTSSTSSALCSRLFVLHKSGHHEAESLQFYETRPRGARARTRSCFLREDVRSYFKRESAREECLETYPTRKTAGASQRSLETKKTKLEKFLRAYSASHNITVFPLRRLLILKCASFFVSDLNRLKVTVSFITRREKRHERREKESF